MRLFEIIYLSSHQGGSCNKFKEQLKTPLCTGCVWYVRLFLPYSWLSREWQSLWYWEFSYFLLLSFYLQLAFILIVVSTLTMGSLEIKWLWNRNALHGDAFIGHSSFSVNDGALVLDVQWLGLSDSWGYIQRKSSCQVSLGEKCF